LVLDPLAFDQIVGWSKGERHDGRPILRLTHHPLTRITSVPARRFLWWTWGNAFGPAVERTTTLAFGRRTNPIFRAIGAELDRRNVPEGPSFVIRPAGTRTQRMREWRGPLGVYRRMAGSLASGIERRCSPSGRVRAAPPVVELDRGRGARAARITVTRPAAIITSELSWLVVMRWSSSGRRTARTAEVDRADQPVP
jgi:hypothetical protein